MLVMIIINNGIYISTASAMVKDPKACPPKLANVRHTQILHSARVSLYHTRILHMTSRQTVPPPETSRCSNLDSLAIKRTGTLNKNNFVLRNEIVKGNDEQSCVCKQIPLMTRKKPTLKYRLAGLPTISCSELPDIVFQRPAPAEESVFSCRTVGIPDGVFLGTIHRLGAGTVSKFVP